MAFGAQWNGIGANVGIIQIEGDDARYRIRWGDGQEDVVRNDEDRDGDGVGDSNPIHFYGQDGTYDVEVQQIQGGLPPVRLKAFMYAGATNDVTIGGTFLSDIMVSGSGNDDLRGASGNDEVAGRGGNDRLYGQAGDDFLLGGEGEDLILGGVGSDLITGNEGADTLQGGADRDFIFGDAGTDRLFGEDGDDYLQGDGGVDRLYGGAGADEFVFVRPRDVDNNELATDPDRDSIVDFQQGVDHIQVSQWFGGGFSFVGGARFSGAGDELRFVQVNGVTVVFGDVDGDRVADFSFRIETGATPLATDFG